MRDSQPSLKVAFLGDYPPRHCGLATFTRELRQAVASAQTDWSCQVIAVSDRPGSYAYDESVRFEVPQPDVASYLRAADFLNLAHTDILCVQHEFGIYGGVAGSHVLGLIRAARMPVVTTLHTVLEKPQPEQKRAFAELLDNSTRVVVMARLARNLLTDFYHVPEEKITIIPHGIPNLPFTDSGYFKDQFDIAGRTVILTFGLLSPNKGIEYAIRALPAIKARHPGVIYIILGATHPNVLRESGENYRLSLERLARSLGVESNVMFVNRYVGEAELADFMGAADIYLTPYLNVEQITSGTLSYCYGTGKAVVSTPYWHAGELLADNRGVLVPFRDADAIAREVNALLSDEARLRTMRKDAYVAGRQMIWSEVGKAYAQLFIEAREHYHATGAVQHGGRRGALRDDRLHLPPWRFDHLLCLSDSTGMFQHANFSVPWFEHGYCADDNARALLLSVLLEELGECPPELLHARSAYAGFIYAAYSPARGRFRNFMSFGRSWLDEEGSEDVQGRALWALGAVVGRSPGESLRAWAAPLFEAALPAVEEFTSPRAWAFAVLGLHEYLRTLSGDLLAARLRESFSWKLLALWQANRADDWPWFEDIVAYDNARLSHALILTGRWTENTEMRDAGLESLKWLMSKQTGVSGCFRPIGSEGFWRRGQECPVFDQQPVEAAASVSACIEAYFTTSDDFWRAEARRAFEWYLGANDIEEPLYDPATGGCRDGLHANRVNLNQGAESTLSFWLALAEMKALANVSAAYNRTP
jgi:glycosyltransferase involved in cell wall biosynthesis